MRKPSTIDITTGGQRTRDLSQVLNVSTAAAPGLMQAMVAGGPLDATTTLPGGAVTSLDTRNAAGDALASQLEVKRDEQDDQAAASLRLIDDEGDGVLTVMVSDEWMRLTVVDATDESATVVIAVGEAVALFDAYVDQDGDGEDLEIALAHTDPHQGGNLTIDASGGHSGASISATTAGGRTCSAVFRRGELCEFLSQARSLAEVSNRPSARI